MPNFMDLPREVRDMIYAEAMISDQVLIARGECGGYPNNKNRNDYEADFRHSGPTLALLRVNKTTNSETTPVFLAVNTFKLSPLPSLGRSSVFTKHGSLFRNVAVELYSPNNDKYWAGEVLDHGTYEKLI